MSGYSLEGQIYRKGCLSRENCADARFPVEWSHERWRLDAIRVDEGRALEDSTTVKPRGLNTGGDGG